MLPSAPQQVLCVPTHTSQGQNCHGGKKKMSHGNLFIKSFLVVLSNYLSTQIESFCSLNMLINQIKWINYSSVEDEIIRNSHFNLRKTYTILMMNPWGFWRIFSILAGILNWSYFKRSEWSRCRRNLN